MRRDDGRAPDQLRPVSFERGFMHFAEGSCLVSFGNTRVVCAATVEEGVPRFLEGTGRGWVTGEYSMLPRATYERTGREAARGRPSGRTQEIQRLIGRSLRAIVDLTALDGYTITVDCDCLGADGGTRTASITGGLVALVDAVRSLGLKRDPITDHVAAVSVGVLGGVVCLDLDYSEDSTADVDMNVVMTGSGSYVEVQGTAEGTAFDKPTLDTMLASAARGIGELIAAQREVLSS